MQELQNKNRNVRSVTRKKTALLEPEDQQVDTAAPSHISHQLDPILPRARIAASTTTTDTNTLLGSHCFGYLVSFDFDNLNLAAARLGRQFNDLTRFFSE